jgi:hypothetical protein
MTCKVYERIVEKFGTAHLYHCILGVEIHTQFGIAIAYKIGKRCRIGIPVATSSILK